MATRARKDSGEVQFAPRIAASGDGGDLVLHPGSSSYQLDDFLADEGGVDVTAYEKPWVGRESGERIGHGVTN